MIRNLVLAGMLLATPLPLLAKNVCALPDISQLQPAHEIHPERDANSCLQRQVKHKPDYYMLSLSWSPAFCEKMIARNDGNVPESLKFQCGPDNHFGWVVHGLWAQSLTPESCTTPDGKSMPLHPRYCGGDLPALAPATIAPFMCTQPGADLLQGEWEKHGSCGFDNPVAYFEKTRVLFNALVLPESNPGAKELFRWMKQNNPALKAVRLGFAAGANELQVCYTPGWQVRDCPDK